MAKGKVFLIIFGVLIVLIMAGGITFFFLFWQNVPQDPSEKPGEIAELGEFVVNVQHQRSLRIVRTEISLEVIGRDSEEALSKNRAQIRDAIIKVLRGSGEEAIEDPAASNLKEEIIREINSILGEEIVRNVYFTEFVVQ